MEEYYASLWLDNRLLERFRQVLPQNMQERPFREQLQCWQYMQLLQLLTRTKNAVWYKTLDSTPDERAVYPSESYADAVRRIIAALPMTTPDDLAVHAEQFLTVSHSAVAGVVSVATSGTTGAAKRVFCSEHDLELTIDFFAHGMQYFACAERGDTVVLLMSGDRPGSVGHLLYTAMTRMGIACHVLGFPTDIQAAVNKLCQIRPTCLVGVPAHVLALAQHCSGTMAMASLHSVLLSGDAVTPSLRATLEAKLQCQVFVHYGLTETGFGGAVECRAGNGCHIREGDLFVEIVTPQGEAVTPGEWGEVLLTTLTREAQPLLRYKTGDYGRILSEPCTCGSQLQRLDVRGRLRDTITLSDTAHIHLTELDTLIYASPWVVAYRVVLYLAHADERIPSDIVFFVDVGLDAPCDAAVIIQRVLTEHDMLRQVNNEVTFALANIHTHVRIHYPGQNETLGETVFRRKCGIERIVGSFSANT